MRKALVMVLLYLTTGLSASAQQNGILSGTLTDTSSKQSLYKAVVSVLDAKDSMLVKFTRTDQKGHFEIRNLPAGRYIILTTFPTYADYTDTLSLAQNAVMDLGNINMITMAHLLQEVVVKQTVAAVRMKGDTLEFKADSFKVQANASVEDLLKRIPGMQVDKNGQITVQGKKVQKVLVDGEEFFGDDPTLVTQNLRANMIDKVQVFDKKSEQADFTGVDDGQREKTINLKLKEDKKKGYFGKFDVSAGTKGFYNEQLMFNKFRKKEKISVYGIFSNTGKTGLNWRDREKFGDNSTGIEYDEGGDTYFSSGGSDDVEGWGGNYNGQGYPTVQSGGLHYNNKWEQKKTTALNGNYKFMNLSVNGASGTSSQYILPDTMYFTSQRQQFNNSILRNKGNLVYDLDFDTTSTLKIIVDANSDDKKTRSQYVTEARGEDSLLVNSGTRTVTSDALVQGFNSSLMWRKKMPKTGRTLSISGKQNYAHTDATGYILADNQFYKNGIQNSTQLTDQYRASQSRSLAFNVAATYTEPLSQAASLVLNYGFTMNNSANNRSSYNKSGGGKYDVLDSLYSNDYKFDYFSQKAGASLNVVQKKYRFNIGNTVGFTDYTQTDLRSNTKGTRDFVNWFPQANFRYTFNRNSSLSANYNGSTAQPSLQQLQPLRTNDDPLNIVIGNPSLQPSFRNRVSLQYYNFQALSGRDFWIDLSYNNTNNAFASSDSVDAQGKRISQTINVDGNYNINGYASYGFKLFGASLSFSTQYGKSRYMNFVNGIKNETNSNNYSFSFYVGKEVDKVYNNSISADASYTESRSSVQKDVKVHYWTYSINPDFDFFFPWKLQLHMDCNFQFRQKTSAFADNNNVVLLNGWLGKKLLKGDALLLKVSGNDILNQNIGFNRNVSSNFITQSTYSTIQRYFMLSAVWNFTKNPGQ